MVVTAQELRIGNWVRSMDKDGYSCNYQVKTICERGINDFVSQGGYEKELFFRPFDDSMWAEGIPLTEELLKDMGFISDGTYWMMIFVPEVTLPGIDLPVFRLPIRPDGTFGYGVRNVKTVHQLQNLYYEVTGEELKVKYSI